jgi:hypothetical protein
LDDQATATDQATPAEPIPPGEPYETAKQADADYRQLVGLYWDVRDTSAGKRLLVYAMRDIRPDAARLKGAAAAALDPANQLAGTPDDVTARFTALAHAAQTLTRNLTEDRYRAPQFMASLRQFTEATEHVAGRLASTAQDPGLWARLFPPTQTAPSLPAADEQLAASPADHLLPLPGPGEITDPDTGGQAAAAPHNDTAAGSATSQTPASPPAMSGFAERLTETAASHGLSVVPVHGTGPAQTVQVVDAGRGVLLYSPDAGATAGGLRVHETDVPAYLAAYQADPHLPPAALLATLQQLPGPLTLSRARELAAAHGLQVRIVREAGTSYITLHEPAVPSPPVLSCPAGGADAFHGPCPVPAAAISGYLTAYRQRIPPHIFDAVPTVSDWARRIAQLTPHLIEGSGHHIAEVADNAQAALRARRDETADAARYLDRAEIAAPPLTLTPEREAQITQAIRDSAPGYYRAGGDPARYITEGHVHGSDREQRWISRYISAHPDVTQGNPVSPPAVHERNRIQAAGDAAAADSLSRAAHSAFTSGQLAEALRLLDEAELTDPARADHWERIRAHVRQASHTAAQQPGSAGPSPGATPGQLATEPEAGQ